MQVTSQAVLRPHVLVLPPLALAARFAPFAAKVLAWAGVAGTAQTIDRARAVVGWFAAHAVHPQPFLHPAGTTLNTAVLPVGESWASFNAIFGVPARTNSDTDYWYGLFPDGVTMLQRLIGTTNIAGVTTDDGMLTEHTPGQWRIRDFVGFRSVECTLQCKMAQVVLAALGIPSVDISTVAHDPMAFYDNDSGRWLYIDPTFGEMLTVSGQAQTALDLLQLSLSGATSSIDSSKLPGADYIPVGFFTSPNSPVGGMSQMTIHTAPQWAGGLSARAPYRYGNLPSQSVANDRPGTIAQLMPQLGVGVAGLAQSDTAVEIRLRSNWPDHAKFQVSLDGINWADCSNTDYRSPSAGVVRYRSVDINGFPGQSAQLTL